MSTEPETAPPPAQAVSDESRAAVVSTNDPLEWRGPFGGGKGSGTPFAHRTGAPVSKFEFWIAPAEGVNPNGALRAIRVTYANGQSSELYGEATGIYYEVVLRTGEAIIYFKVLMSKDTSDFTFLSGLQLKSDMDREWVLGSRYSDFYHLNMSAYSGFCFAIEGTVGGYKSGKYIDTIEFGFLESVAAIQCDMKYLTFPDPNKIEGVSFKTLDGNNLLSDEPFVMQIGESETETNSVSTSKTYAEEFGEKVSASVTVGGSAFGVSAEATATAEVEVKQTSTYSTSSSYEKSHTISWSGQIVVPPRTHYRVELMYYKIFINLKFEPTIVFITDKENTISYKGKTQFVTGGASGVATFTVTKMPPRTGAGKNMFGLDGRKMLLGGAEDDAQAVIHVMTSAGSTPLVSQTAPAK